MKVPVIFNKIYRQIKPIFKKEYTNIRVAHGNTTLKSVSSKTNANANENNCDILNRYCKITYAFERA